eukprot:CAMPEP_0183708464 /NCGR_PEP_ID=MMETSP0737-20130205/4787_1 /TAXON_ID=385413 /ORGANISM="Thalassiosira miniscula, Strain CCMP1093" /LENGTH=1717 /DNA_ID=CAMNT_0025936357 /DNA_START=82 /DNA_END=5235 /DNA_ORIENTATION=-
MADDDDDDFEDLFSFGAGGAPSTDAGATQQQNSRRGEPSSTGSDFDILSDGSTSPEGSAGSAVPITPRGDGDAGDEFDDLFGTPPPVTTSAMSSRDLNADDADNILGLDEVGDDAPKNSGLSSMDDFHVHDEDTRDMLDWLDDDTTGKKKEDSGMKDIAVAGVDEPAKISAEGGAPTKTVGDDFDFDQIIAESHDDSSKGKQGASQQAQPAKAEATATPTPSGDATEAKVEAKSTAPEKPAAVARVTSIEEDLALDQWEDDNEEMEDLQMTGSGENSEGSSDANSPSKKEGGASMDKKQPPSPKKIKFSSLADAIRSNASSLEDVQSLFRREKGLEFLAANDEDRAHLWTKVICGKTVNDIEDGSLADSFREWVKKREEEVIKQFEGEHSELVDALLKQACSTSDDDTTYAVQKQNLLSLLHFHSHNKSDPSTHGTVDPLIPPVALALLSAGIPPAAASVVLSHVEPAYMPLLRLSHDERYLAAKALHADFYLLACYHLPLLVMHFDSHCPGWYWPRKDQEEEEEEKTTEDATKSESQEEKTSEEGDKTEGAEAKGADDSAAAASEDGKGNTKETGEEVKAAPAEEGQPEGAETILEKKQSKLEANGLIPLTWFVTTFAGKFGGLSMDHQHLLQLWDNVLTKGDHSFKYFLAIAVLEKHSDILLMSRGEELKGMLEKILDFRQEAAFAEESFVGAIGDGEANTDAEMVSEWLMSGKSLIESTPSSVIQLLRSADDRAVAKALEARQTRVDEELKAQLDADELARKKERDQRDKEAERALNKARLTAYYRTYNPEKVDTIEQILNLFDGRMPVLNDKLKNKYGKGFLPEEALKDQTRSFLMSVNQSITDTRKHVSVAVAERRKKQAKVTPESLRKYTPVALEVSPTEVIPVICTTKAHNLKTGKKMIPPKRTSDTTEPLQFYLVDCRPESIAAEQGRFPTAVRLSPEKLQDPDELKKLTDMFESLRGAVHICVMGEGFASFPVLYNHTLSKEEEKLLEDDLARTGQCALFFLKKGFPFVSVLRGGFAAAHAFLERNGPDMGMAPTEVLIDYDPVVSLFAQLETARQEEEHYKNAPAREKTVRTLQKIIDSSMTRLTLEEQRINSLANDLAKPENVGKMKQSVSNFLAKPKTVPSMSFGRTPPLFISKQFPAASAKKEESELAQDDDAAKPGLSFKEKISVNMPSFRSEVSDVDEKSGTESVSAAPADAVAPSNEAKDENSATESQSKISSAFTSLTQRIQQSKTPTADGGMSTSESNPSPKEGGGMSFSSFTSRIKQVADTKSSEETKDSATKDSSEEKSSSDKENAGEPSETPKESAASKISFSSFASRIKQVAPEMGSVKPVAVTNASEETKDSAETFSSSDKENAGESLETPKESAASKISFSSFASRIKQAAPEIGSSTTQTSDKDSDGGAVSVSSSKVSSAFASLSQRIQQTTAVAPAPDSKEPTSQSDAGKEEGSSSKISFSGFANRIKLGQQAAEQSENPPEKADDDKVSEEEKDSSSENNDEKPHVGGTASSGVARDKLTKFTKSFGDTLSGLRDTAANAKISKDSGDSVPTKSEEEEANAAISTENATDVGRFSKFTKSIGGGLSGLRTLNPKADSADAKTIISEGEETDSVSKSADIEPKASAASSVSKAISSLGDTSLGKMLLQDEPRAKTRFQRMQGEESISFQEDEEVFADVSLTDVSLTDGDDDVPVQAGDSKDEGDGGKMVTA